MYYPVGILGPGMLIWAVGIHKGALRIRQLVLSVTNGTANERLTDSLLRYKERAQRLQLPGSHLLIFNLSGPDAGPLFSHRNGSTWVTTLRTTRVTDILRANH